MNTFTPFYILSASRDHVNANERAYRNNLLTRQLRKAGLATAACRGFYKGKPETSVLVIDEHAYNNDCLDTVLRLARTCDQETVLAVDANRNAHLVFVDGRPPQQLGKFTCVTEEGAKAQDAYTVRAGRYYVCVS